MKITTEFVPDNAKRYLTAGKEYQVEDATEDSGWITDDEGDEVFMYFDKCEHLDNRSWSICDAK